MRGDDMAHTDRRRPMTSIAVDEPRERPDEVIDQLAHGGEPVPMSRDGITVVQMAPTMAIWTR
jgi:hypothetical protein